MLLQQSGMSPCYLQSYDVHVHPVDADYVHGPIKRQRIKHLTAREKPNFSDFSLAFLNSLPERRRPFTPLHNWYVSRISLELHQGVF